MRWTVCIAECNVDVTVPCSIVVSLCHAASTLPPNAQSRITHPLLRYHHLLELHAILATTIILVSCLFVNILLSRDFTLSAILNVARKVLSASGPISLRGPPFRPNVADVLPLRHQYLCAHKETHYRARGLFRCIETHSREDGFLPSDGMGVIPGKRPCRGMSGDFFADSDLLDFIASTMGQRWSHAAGNVRA